MPGIDDEDRLVLLHDRELEVGGRPRADDGHRDLRAHAGHREQQREEPELLGRPEAVQRLQVLADDVVGEELQRAPGCADGEHRRRRVHPIADPTDLDDQRIERDRADDAVERGDHASVARSGRFAARRRLRAASASRTARS